MKRGKEATTSSKVSYSMRFVQVKSAEQQGQLMQHRTRDLLMRQRTQSINALRAHLAETRHRGRKGR
jgi:transposase